MFKTENKNKMENLLESRLSELTSEFATSVNREEEFRLSELTEIYKLFKQLKAEDLVVSHVNGDEWSIENDCFEDVVLIFDASESEEVAKIEIECTEGAELDEDGDLIKYLNDEVFMQMVNDNIAGIILKEPENLFITPA